MFYLLASVEGTTICLEIPLNPPPPPGDHYLATPPPPHTRLSRAMGGHSKGGSRGSQHFIKEVAQCPTVDKLNFLPPE